jgi:hypothetical protein
MVYDVALPKKMTEGLSKQLLNPEGIIPKKKFYVTMTDKFMSGWGMAKDKTNKLVIGVDTYEQAEIIKSNAEKRDEMKYINITSRKPYYNSRTVKVSYKNIEELGEIWTKSYEERARERIEEAKKEKPSGKPTYYYKIIKSRVNRMYGGREETAEVYKVVNGQIVSIGETSWSTRGYKGEEGEIMDVLLKVGVIDKKEWNKSESEHSGGGYYRRDKNNFEIKEL